MSGHAGGEGEPVPLPRLALLADGFARDPAVAGRVRAAVCGGVRWVHLRDHDAPPERFAAEAAALAGRLRADAPDVRLTVNTRADVARTLEAGLHVGTRGPSVAEARRVAGAGAVVGYSAHAPEEVARAAREGAGYVFFSPIYPTTSKPGAAGQGTEALVEAARVAPVPVYALGGVTPERVAPCLVAGAYGVAVLSGILRAAEPAAAAAAYQDALRRALHARS